MYHVVEHIIQRIIQTYMQTNIPSTNVFIVFTFVNSLPQTVPECSVTMFGIYEQTVFASDTYHIISHEYETNNLFSLFLRNCGISVSYYGSISKHLNILSIWLFKIVSMVLIHFLTWLCILSFTFQETYHFFSLFCFTFINGFYILFLFAL